MRVFFILACLLLWLMTSAQPTNKAFMYVQGATVRGDSIAKQVALVFTADEWGEGLSTIRQTLKKERRNAGFFFTGRFYRNPGFQPEIKRLQKDGHYLGPHSDMHLLYCAWAARDSLLVTKDSFEKDLAKNIGAMKGLQLPAHWPLLFIAPFEWWNDSIAAWSKANNLLLFNFTPGTFTNADYTWPELSNYKSSDWILSKLEEKLNMNPSALSGAIFLIHAGTDPRRTDKFYNRLPSLFRLLKKYQYKVVSVNHLLGVAAVPTGHS